MRWPFSSQMPSTFAPFAANTSPNTPSAPRYRIRKINCGESMNADLSQKRHFFRWSWLALVSVLLVVGSAPASDGGWQKKVPEADRSRSNPEANDPGAVAAGGKLYAEKCAKCHGENAEGKGHHPSLRTETVQQVTPGELEWLIQHGNRWHMMPSFAGLPETQRWQIVSYIKSLPSATK